jgi:hypothetical protein
MLELIICIYGVIGAVVVLFQAIFCCPKNFYWMFLSFIFWPVAIPVLCVRHIVEQHESEERDAKHV